MGLRGGRFTSIERNGVQVVTLDAVRWTEDLAVSGTIEKTPGPASRVRAHLRLAGADSLEGALEIVWDDAPDAVAAHPREPGRRAAGRADARAAECYAAALCSATPRVSPILRSALGG